MKRYNIKHEKDGKYANLSFNLDFRGEGLFFILCGKEHGPTESQQATLSQYLDQLPETYELVESSIREATPDIHKRFKPILGYFINRPKENDESEFETIIVGTMTIKKHWFREEMVTFSFYWNHGKIDEFEIEYNKI